MAWPTSSTVAAAGVITAAGRNALRADMLAINGFVRKTADESVTSSTTLQNDDHLVYTISNTGTYIIDCYLFGTSAANAAGDIAVGFSFPAGTLHFGGPFVDGAIAAGTLAGSAWPGQLSATSGTTTIAGGLTTSVMFWRVHGILIATGTGTLQMMWAQFASNANASTLKSGSHMLVRQVA